MKPFYNSHLPEQWLMRLHLKHKRPGALDARDCFIIINVSGSSCTRRSRISSVPRPLISEDLTREGSRWLLQSDKVCNTWVMNRSKLFWRCWQLGGVRMCEGIQTDNAGEIVRMGLRITEKKDRGKKKKEEKIREKIRQTHAERRASWGPKAGQGNWPLVGATSPF